MRLWTIQHYSAYETMLETGILAANEEHLLCQDELCQDNFRYAYNWMSHKMIEANILPPNKIIHYPVWAWYQWEGKRKGGI